MIYYRVKQEDDNRKRYRGKKMIGFYIGGEIVTEREALKQNYDLSRLERIETSKHNTYWCFGARFVSDESKVRTCQNS